MIPILYYYQSGQNCICDMQCHIYLSHTTTLKQAQKMLQDNVTYSCHMVYLYSKNTIKQLKHIANQSLSLLHKSCLKSTGMPQNFQYPTGISGGVQHSGDGSHVAQGTIDRRCIIRPFTFQVAGIYR